MKKRKIEKDNLRKSKNNLGRINKKIIIKSALFVIIVLALVFIILNILNVLSEKRVEEGDEGLGTIWDIFNPFKWMYKASVNVYESKGLNCVRPTDKILVGYGEVCLKHGVNRLGHYWEQPRIPDNGYGRLVDCDTCLECENPRVLRSDSDFRDAVCVWRKDTPPFVHSLYCSDNCLDGYYSSGVNARCVRVNPTNNLDTRLTCAKRCSNVPPITPFNQCKTCETCLFNECTPLPEGSDLRLLNGFKRCDGNDFNGKTMLSGCDYMPEYKCDGNGNCVGTKTKKLGETCGQNPNNPNDCGTCLKCVANTCIPYSEGSEDLYRCSGSIGDCMMHDDVVQPKRFRCHLVKDASNLYVKDVRCQLFSS